MNMDTMTVEAMTLDCGHPPTPNGGVGTGCVRNAETGKTQCYACNAQQLREYMQTHDAITLYLVPCNNTWAVTNWPGSLTFRAYGVRTSKHGGGFGAQRRDAWFRDENGREWHAINRGDTEVARCRKVSVKPVRKG